MANVAAVKYQVSQRNFDVIIIIIISSLRAFRRARDGAAMGRGSWGRSRWPDAKFVVAGAKCDLRNEQQ